MPEGHRWRDLVVLLAILALAALTRLPGLDLRGRWDADQGHDMLVLQAFVTRGDVPLLGPPTSIGTFHHGALYYDLLAPAALVSGSDPVIVTAEIALLGIAAVAATWWLGRIIGGPLAGAVAGLLAAVSPAGIDESTFIWNPNPIPLFAALAMGGAIRAWQTRRARWWLLAAVGAMVTAQLHVLGIVLVPPLAAIWLADLRRRGGDGPGRRPLVQAGLVSIAILAAGYVPLLVHELGHDFSEVRAILDYVAAGGGGSNTGVAQRAGIVGLRSITWPLIGLMTDVPAAAGIAAVAALVLGGIAVVFRLPATGAGERVEAREDGTEPASAPVFARWLALTLAWSVAALAVLAPSLATVTPGLPNDHYHAFLDPLVLALVGTGLATVAGGAAVAGAARVPGRSGAASVQRLTAAAGLVVLVGVCVWRWPPPVAEDGGWPLADAAAARVIDAAGEGRPIALAGIPSLKSADALGFPLERRGAATITVDPGLSAPAGAALVIVCDPLFDQVDASPCGGPAELGLVASMGGSWKPADAFAAGPRRFVWVFSREAGS